MSGLLFNYGGFHAQGTEIHGVGISEEQETFGNEVASNGTVGLPAAILALQVTALAAGDNLTGLVPATK